MLQIQTSINDVVMPVFIFPHEERGTYIVSIPDMNFSLEYSRTLSESDQAEEIILHLFNVMDEAACEAVARDITRATSTK
ncbi:YueH family protein [Salinicoccus roseus]|uniref:YueH family protein n=1 Tax=Salinicoccus roseus TaxID=45670 RepID=UPI00356AB3B1